MNKLLSIVVPSYNSETYLVNTIPTILDIKNINFLDLIIVNDGSTDNTLNVANQFKYEYPDVVNVIDKENGGHGSTINIGIKVAKGKYFKVIDADDFVISKNLDELIEFLKNTDVDEVISPFFNYYENKQIYEEVNYSKYRDIITGKIYNYSNFLEIIDVLPRMHSITIKTNILKENNIKISENLFYVDMEYISFPIPYIDNITFYGKPVYVYRLGTQGQSVNINNYIKNRFMLKHICTSLVNFYEENKNIFSEKEKELILNLINGIIGITFKVYLSMNNINNYKHELINFNNDFRKYVELNKQKKVIYSSIFNFKLFNIMNLFYRLINKLL